MCGDSFDFDDDQNGEVVAGSQEDEEPQRNEHDETYVERIEENGPDTDDNVIKMLIATDIHCGYAENKHPRNDDSVNTLEEILQIATKKKVDFVLLGGDLFHENSPSRKVTNQVTQLLRQYCLNDNEVKLQYLSNPEMNFAHSRFPRVNFEDENLNIGLPIFTIHGNHDDLTGCGQTALDSLHESGLLNLFGKYENIEKFEVGPILLRKGSTNLALYGIGSQRDDRLARSLSNKQALFLRPDENVDDWFNLLVLHQNRPARNMHRSTGSYVPERLLPNFFDLVVWGHEHECIPSPKFVASSTMMGDGFYILQPGSSIATSLTEPEAIEKCVFYVKVKGRKFTSKPIPLQTVRPLVVDDLVLDTMPTEQLNKRAERPTDPNKLFFDEIAVHKKLEIMLKSAKKLRTEASPWPPLLRLTVHYKEKWSKVKPLKPSKIGSMFIGKVANPMEMLMIKVERIKATIAKNGSNITDMNPLGKVTRDTLEEVVNDYFRRQPLSRKMTIFNCHDINKAMCAYGDLESNEITLSRANTDFAQCLELQTRNVEAKLLKMDEPEIEVGPNGHLDFAKFEADIRNDLKILKKTYYEKSGEYNEADDHQDGEDDDPNKRDTSSSSDCQSIHEEEDNYKPVSRRGRGAARATRAGRGRGKK